MRGAAASGAPCAVPHSMECRQVLPVRPAARQGVVSAAVAVQVQAPATASPVVVRAPAAAPPSHYGPRTRPNFDLPNALAATMELTPSLLEQIYPAVKVMVPESQRLLPGVATARGPRQREMQDRHHVVANVARAAARQLGAAKPHPHAALWTGQLPSLLVGVFDGHGGRSTSSRACARMDELITRDRALWDILGQGLGCLGHATTSSSVVRLMQNALTRIFRTLDEGILAEDRMRPPGTLDGTSALVGLQVGDHLFVARLGSSHAVVSRAGAALRCGQADHTPGDAREQRRVKAAGGRAGQLRGSGSWRLVLKRQHLRPKLCPVTRALGDLDWKEPQPIISVEPEVVHVALQPGRDKFVVYASAGVWGVVSEQQAVDCVDTALTAAQLAGLPLHDAARAAASALMMHARMCGSTKDITVVVAPLPAAAITPLHFALPWLN